MPQDAIAQCMCDLLAYTMRWCVRIRVNVFWHLVLHCSAYGHTLDSHVGSTPTRPFHGWSDCPDSFMRAAS